MNIMELGAIGELVGGVAVIASLIYVGLQIRHNARSVESTMHTQLLEATNTMNALMISSNDVAELLHRGRSEPATLSPTEWTRFAEYAFMRFGIWEAAFLNHRKRTVDHETWLAWEGGFKAVTTGPGYKRFWQEYGEAHSPSFQQYVDSSAVFTPR